MQLCEPKRKKFAPQIPQPLPKIKKPFEAIFNGFSVIVEDSHDVRNTLGVSCYGKPNLSRGYTNAKKETEIIRKRQFEGRRKFFDRKNKLEKVIVLPDSDSEDDEYLKKDIKPVYELDTSGLKEKLYLELPEAYFLQNDEKCLAIAQNGDFLNAQQCWQEFSGSDKYFAQNYVCYHHFRRKNWVVKPGLKFGGDYLLYKNGPVYHHASYVVIIDILNESNLERRNDLCRRSMNTRDIVGLNRLCESTGKELLIFQILWPNNVQILTNDDVKQLTVKEVLMRRWDPNSKQMN